MTTKTLTADRPITLHGSCHVPDSFCDGVDLCSIPYQKNLVPDWPTHVQVSGTRRLVPVSVTCVAGFTFTGTTWKCQGLV